MKHANMVTYNTILFLPKFLWPHYSGPPGARGPGFIKPPETPISTPLLLLLLLSPTGEHTCFAGTATVNRSPHWHSSRR